MVCVTTLPCKILIILRAVIKVIILLWITNVNRYVMRCVCVYQMVCQRLWTGWKAKVKRWGRWTASQVEECAVINFTSVSWCCRLDDREGVQHTHAYHCNSHFPCHPGNLSGCPLHSLSHLYPVHPQRRGWNSSYSRVISSLHRSLNVDCHFNGFWSRIFMSQMLFLSPNQQRQSTEGKQKGIHSSL